MSIATVVTEGYGSFGSLAFVVTEGYGTFGAPPSPPAFDPNGVQGSGGGPPKKRPILRLDERYRPQIVDPREYSRTSPKPSRTSPLEARTSADLPQGDLPPLPDVPRRMPAGLAERVEAIITAAERKRALAELAADDEEAMLAILFAALT